MAFPAEQPAPPSEPTRERPVQVTAAVWSLYVLAAIQILSIILGTITMGPTLDATREYVEGTQDGDTIIASVQIGSYATLVFGALFAVGFGVLGFFVNRGNQPARIISWVVLGLSLCCNGFGLLGAAAGGALSGGGTGSAGEIDQEELTRRIGDAVPGWISPVNYVLLFIGIAASAAGIILLALPAANEYFRRRPQAVWEPPVPGAYYPAAPGAPVADVPVPGTSAPAATPAGTPPPVDVTKPPADNPVPAEDPVPTAEPVAAEDPVPTTEPVADDAPRSADDPATDDKKPGPTGQPGTGNPPPAL